MKNRPIFKLTFRNLGYAAFAATILFVFQLAHSSGQVKPESVDSQSNGTASNNTTGNRTGKKRDKNLRLREGTRIIDRLGYFKASGEGMTFYSMDGDVSFQGLENLALERVARVIDNVPGRAEWSVTGTLTEFREVNYLYVTRAVLKGSGGNKSESSRRN